MNLLNLVAPQATAGSKRSVPKVYIKKTVSLIGHVSPTIARSAGGPSVSVRRLIEALKKKSPAMVQCLFAGDAAHGGNALADWGEIEPRLFRTFGPRRLGWSPGLRDALVESKPRLIHVHGLWQYHAWAADRASRQLNIPLVISPRGMLEPWALGRGRAQKWLANNFFQQRMLSEVDCIVATSPLEAAGVRAAGFNATPIAVIPNGVDLPPTHFQSAAGRHKASADRRTALFLSRIHPKKGISDLLTAWKSVAPTSWRLRIVGPSDGSHATEVADQIAASNLEANVTMEGPLWGDAKLQAYAEADLFILPSYSENFGLVIAEALAAGVPVITTTATPWKELLSERCGWWIEPGPSALTATLRIVLEIPSEELVSMGRRGRRLMERRYSWNSVARDMADVYSWLFDATTGPPAQLMFP
jgi:glycosyltransferase involved in cell wall biosynthesis